jgi:hypothetical protein
MAALKSRAAWTNDVMMFAGCISISASSASSVMHLPFASLAHHLSGFSSNLFGNRNIALPTIISSYPASQQPAPESDEYYLRFVAGAISPQIVAPVYLCLFFVTSRSLSPAANEIILRHFSPCFHNNP